jgi:hypothetical protein
MKKSDLINLIRESFNESFNENLKEEEIFGSKDMVQQNINSITLSLEVIQENIDYAQVEDWVDDKIAKISREMSNLKEYFAGKIYAQEDKELDEDISCINELDDENGYASTLKEKIESVIRNSVTNKDEIIEILEEILRERKGEGYTTKDKVRKNWMK